MKTSRQHALLAKMRAAIEDRVKRDPNFKPEQIDWFETSYITPEESEWLTTLKDNDADYWFSQVYFSKASVKTDISSDVAMTAAHCVWAVRQDVLETSWVELEAMADKADSPFNPSPWVTPAPRLNIWRQLFIDRTQADLERSYPRGPKACGSAKMFERYRDMLKLSYANKVFVM